MILDEDIFKEEAGRLLLGDKDLNEYHETSFVISKKKIIKQFNSVKMQFNGLIETDVHYPVIVNPDTDVINTLHELGSGFSCGSMEELRLMKNTIGSLSKVLFLGPNITLEMVDELMALGVKNVVVDSDKELYKLKNKAEEKGYKFNVFLRVFVDPECMEKYYETETYMGAMQEMAVPLLVKARNMGFVDKLGVYFNFMSQNVDIDAWKYFSDEIIKVMATLKKGNVHVDYLNIGEGFPIEYNAGLISIKNIFDALQPDLAMLKGMFQGIKLMIEPGRYIVGPSVVLVTKVNGVKNFNDQNNVAYVDASLYNCYIDKIRTRLELPCYVANKMGADAARHYVIRGKSIHPDDIFSKECYLPFLEEGDTIVFANAGAFSYYSDLSLKKPNAYMV